MINPPHLIVQGNIWKRIARSIPPLNLGYLASFLEKEKVNVGILDVAAERFTREELVYKLKCLNPAFIGITATTTVINAAMEIAEICKTIRPCSKIIFGGVHSTILPDEVLAEPFVDYIVRGEGEWTLLELIRQKPVESIAGLSFKNENKIVHNERRSFISNLDLLPHPAYHLLPMHRYKPSAGNYKRLPAASIITSRGCPGRCTFCYTDITGRKLRFRSAENIFDEIRLLVKGYKIKEISFYDDTFTANRGNVLKLCSLFKKENLHITWSCMSRIDCIDYVLLKEMQSSGCHQIGYGIESADEGILRNINKPIALEEIKKVVRETQAAGIDVRGMFMFGNPGETEETMEKTLKFAIELDCDIAVFNITTPFPGTEMFNWAKEKGYLTTLDWRDYDLSRPVMRLPTVEPEKISYFYKQAYKRFYLRPAYLIKKIFKMRNFLDFWTGIHFLISMIKDWLGI